jgi:uncharacterized protein (TIGR01244 family)
VAYSIYQISYIEFISNLELSDKEMHIINVHGLYNVSPQILPADVVTLSEASFEKIICNRPDFEVPPEIQSKEIEKVAKELGILFEYHPLTHDTMNAHNIEKQMELVDNCANSVLAYCASGTRCTVAWALGQVGKMPKDVILETALKSGYDLTGLF